MSAARRSGRWLRPPPPGPLEQAELARAGPPDASWFVHTGVRAPRRRRALAPLESWNTPRDHVPHARLRIAGARLRSGTSCSTPSGRCSAPGTERLGLGHGGLSERRGRGTALRAARRTAPADGDFAVRLHARPHHASPTCAGRRRRPDRRQHPAVLPGRVRVLPHRHDQRAPAPDGPGRRRRAARRHRLRAALPPAAARGRPRTRQGRRRPAPAVTRRRVDCGPLSALNFLFSDGEHLYAYRLGVFELHWLRATGTGSSSPPSASPTRAGTTSARTCCSCSRPATTSPTPSACSATERVARRSSSRSSAAAAPRPPSDARRSCCWSTRRRQVGDPARSRRTRAPSCSWRASSTRRSRRAASTTPARRRAPRRADGELVAACGGDGFIGTVAGARAQHRGRARGDPRRARQRLRARAGDPDRAARGRAPGASTAPERMLDVADLRRQPFVCIASLRVRLRREPDRQRDEARQGQPGLPVRGAQGAVAVEARALRRSRSTASGTR